MTHDTDLELKPRRGVAGILLIVLLIVGAAGAAMDFGAGRGGRFWGGDEPGARAVIGAAAAVLVVALAHIANLVLGRSARRDESPDV